MSTHIRTPAETESRTETRPTEETSDDRDARDEGHVADAGVATASPNAAKAEETEADAADDTDSWTDRCQRQFSATDTRRLRNLADEANESMPNPE